MHTELKLRHVNAEQLLLGYIERRLEFALARFGDKLGCITVRIGASGRSKTDATLCRITADLHSFGSIVAEASDPDVYTAIDRCTARFARRCASRYTRQRSARAAKISIRVPWSLPIAS
jgi:ribosome-associated translation inhibitor RaiA